MAKSRQIAMRFPEDIKAWLKEQAATHRSSQNSEVIRAIRERMDRVPATHRNAEIQEGAK